MAVAVLFCCPSSYARNIRTNGVIKKLQAIAVAAIVRGGKLAEQPGVHQS